MYLLVLFFLSFAIFFSYFIRSFCVFHVTNVFFWIRERKQGENKTPFAVSSIVFENINKPFIIFWSLLFIWDQNTIRCNKTKEKNQHLSKNSVNTRQTCPRTTEFLSFCFFIETRTPWKFRLIFRAEKSRFIFVVRFVVVDRWRQTSSCRKPRNDRELNDIDRTVSLSFATEKNQLGESSLRQSNESENSISFYTFNWDVKKNIVRLMIKAFRHFQTFVSLTIRFEFKCILSMRQAFLLKRLNSAIDFSRVNMKTIHKSVMLNSSTFSYEFLVKTKKIFDFSMSIVDLNKQSWQSKCVDFYSAVLQSKRWIHSTNRWILLDFIQS